MLPPPPVTGAARHEGQQQGRCGWHRWPSVAVTPSTSSLPPCRLCGSTGAAVPATTALRPGADSLSLQHVPHGTRGRRGNTHTHTHWRNTTQTLRRSPPSTSVSLPLLSAAGATENKCLPSSPRMARGRVSARSATQRVELRLLNLGKRRHRP